MIEAATGLVMRTYPLTDTSLIVHWLTLRQGRLSTAAKGARRPDSPLRGKLDLFYLCDFNFYRSRRSDLHTLKEVALRDAHAPLRTDLTKLQQAAYCAALIEQTTEPDTPLPGMFNLFRGLLRHLVSHAPAQHTVFAFELKLLTELGLKPHPDKLRLTPGTTQLVQYLIERDWPEVARLRPTDAQAAELRQFLHGFMIYHLGKLPDGRAAALNAPAAT
ncbi:MAG: DNA repair protein RecO [Verrucomicrobiae bacterium]|nr:DNA repair protein RecO [Verrucomicrobiae bacterium]MCX7721950.1 DNA repair protein RecO [Verrucomicrobiae bacterium]MDW7981154.1 DNA repair protein RecO [Verrucomicrobiales bacterium]